MNTTNIEFKMNYFEGLRKMYPPEKYSWSAIGMRVLADTYMQTDPIKALSLINSMGEEKGWMIRKQVAESLIRVNNLEQTQNYKEAIAELNQLKLPNAIDMNEFITIKKACLLQKGGAVKAAYDTLAVKFAELPTDRIYVALELYGKEIGKDKKQILKDVDTIKYKNVVDCYPFELGLYSSNQKLSLEQLKGNVVLLTFWFPACSACRAEFPHFQAVMNKFKGEPVKYIGINVSPLQDPYVIPLLEKMKYSFIPLRGSAEFAARFFGVQSEPENFLIDKNGKIIYRNFRIDNDNHRTLELMISSLLEKD